MPAQSVDNAAFSILWSVEVRRMTILVTFSTELLTLRLFRQEEERRRCTRRRPSENELGNFLDFVSRGERGKRLSANERRTRA
jgi:hypothetical protein